MLKMYHFHVYGLYGIGRSDNRVTREMPGVLR